MIKKATGVMLFFLGMLAGVAMICALTVPVLKKQAVALDAASHSNDVWAAMAAPATEQIKDCADRLSVGTVLIEPGAPSVGQSEGLALIAPLMPPAAANLLGIAMAHVYTPEGAPAHPAWMIPAKVTPITNTPGARYRWIDLKTGASLGEFPVQPLTAAADQAAQ